MSNVWQYRDNAWSDDSDLVGYDVEATDGKVGSIDECTTEADTAYVVVDTGSWISGKKRMIPAGLVTTVDHDAKTVSVTVSKDQIQAAPDYEEFTEESQKEYSDYYGPFAW
jgi:PRC-barrel domain protein